jgi:hypothetical protein
MNETIAAVRVIHITAGFLAFVVAPAALVAAKGGAAHRRWGKLYFWSMAVVAVTAIGLAVWRPVAWLGLVAVFSFYSAFSGYRALYRKRPYDGEAASVWDWLAAIVTLSASAVLFTYGIVPPNATWTRISTIAMALGLLGMMLAGVDLVRFNWPSRHRQAWWFAHMGGLLGSYVATVSAFSAVNFTFLPLAARFLWPSVVGVPLIVVWVAYYRARFSRRKVAAVTAFETLAHPNEPWPARMPAGRSNRT